MEAGSISEEVSADGAGGVDDCVFHVGQLPLSSAQILTRQSFSINHTEARASGDLCVPRYYRCDEEAPRRPVFIFFQVSGALSEKGSCVAHDAVLD